MSYFTRLHSLNLVEGCFYVEHRKVSGTRFENVRPEHVLNVSGTLPGHFPEVPGHILDDSWTFPGNVKELSGKCPVDVQEICGEILGNCPVNCPERTGKCSGHVRGIVRHTSGYPGHFWDMFRKCPGKCPGHFRDMSWLLLRTCP